MTIGDGSSVPWYRDRLGRARDYQTRRYWRVVHGDRRRRPEDERPPPSSTGRATAGAAAAGAAGDPAPAAWEPDPPPQVDREPFEADAAADDAAWSPEPEPDPEPDPEPEPAIPTAELLEQLGAGVMWAAAVRWMADPRREHVPAPIRPGEAEMYAAAWAAVIDRYMPDVHVGPIGQLAAVTMMGVVAARGARGPRRGGDDISRRGNGADGADGVSSGAVVVSIRQETEPDP